jgi:hypothetical protein
MATQTLAERTEILAPIGLSPLLTTVQLMARYGVSNWTVNEWVKTGCPVEPTAFRGRRFDLAKVERWMATKDADQAADRASAPPAPEFVPSQRSA